MREVKSEEGVSEVVGTILVLAVTVVLFSTVFAYVQYIPAANIPQQVVLFPEFSLNGREHILYVNLTEKAGSILVRNAAYLMIFINGKEYTNSLTSLQVTGPINGGSDKYFGPGDTVHWNSKIESIEISDNSTFYSLLFYKASNQTLWKSQNYTGNQISVISAYSIPFPLVKKQQFTIVVQIFTLDTSSTSVKVNLTSLFGNNTNESMISYLVSGNLLTYYYSTIAPTRIPANASALVYLESGSSTETYSVPLV